MLALSILALVGWMVAVLVYIGYRITCNERDESRKYATRLSGMNERAYKERDELARQKSNLLETLQLYQQENRQLTDINGKITEYNGVLRQQVTNLTTRTEALATANAALETAKPKRTARSKAQEGAES